MTLLKMAQNLDMLTPGTPPVAGPLPFKQVQGAGQ